MRISKLAGVVIALAAVPATAATYHLEYTTFDDGVLSVASVDALLTTEDGAIYGAPGSQFITAITGTRNGLAIDGFEDFDQIFVPAAPYFVDSFGFSFSVGDTNYNFNRTNSSFYQEFSSSLSDPSAPGEGRLVFDNSVSLTEVVPGPGVPEPAAWALMIAGFGMVGVAGRRRRSAVLA